MSNFEQLPNEILFKIFDYSSLSAKDLISLSKVCNRFDNFFFSEEKLWESKFKQRWPLAWKKIRSESAKSSVVENWKKEVEVSVEISERFEEILNSLSHQLYKFENITSPILKSILKLLDVGNHAPLIAINDLHRIINDNSVSDLTTLYYAKKVLHQVNYYFWSEKLRKFFKLQPECQSLEKGIFYLGKWFCPEDFFGVDYEEVSSKLDKLASEVQLHLRTKYPTHPAATIKLLSPDESLQISLWPDEMCSQIFECIKHIMFTEHNYENFDENTDVFSNKFLRRILGNDRYASIIFKAVSHRLGIHLNLINEGEDKDDISEYLLEWKSPNSEIVVVLHPFYDIRWNDLSEEEQIQIRQKVCPTRRVLPNLAIETFNCLFDEFIEEKPFAAAAMILNIYSLPEDFCELVKCHVFQFCLQHELHLETIIEICEKLLKMTQVEKEKRKIKLLSSFAENLLTIQQEGPKLVNPKRRIKGVETRFATGMIVYRKCAPSPGVVFGWDENYSCKEMPNVFHKNCFIRYEEGQPHYFVLFSDSSVYYLEQEDLYIKREESPPVNNDKVGKYFKAFNGKFYIPNEELQSEFPDDEKFIRDLL